MRIGTVQSLWRYPVKSMLGEQLAASLIGPLGLPGDRGYAIRDERIKEIRGAKKIPRLLEFSARYVDAPTDTHLPPVEITLPTGATVRTDDSQVHARLSEAFGHDVTIWPRQPAENLEHYRRSPRAPDDIRQVLGLEEGDPMPSFEGIPQDIFQYVSPLGTYFDAYPLHVVTTATLQALSAIHPEGQFAPERFRPNIVIATDHMSGGNDEPAWKGKTVRIGEVEILVSVPTIRCVMTTMPQGALPKDPRILRTVVQHHNHHVGVYATIKRAGDIRVGDPVELHA